MTDKADLPYLEPTTGCEWLVKVKDKVLARLIIVRVDGDMGLSIDIHHSDMHDHVQSICFGTTPTMSFDRWTCDPRKLDGSTQRAWACVELTKGTRSKDA